MNDLSLSTSVLKCFCSNQMVTLLHYVPHLHLAMTQPSPKLTSQVLPGSGVPSDLHLALVKRGSVYTGQGFGGFHPCQTGRPHYISLL